MDTHAAVRRLQTHGFTLEQAEDITAAIQEAVSGTPTMVELRQFVLDQDLKLERLRGEMQQFRTDVREEFGRVHEALGQIRTTLAQIHGTLTLQATRIAAITRLAWGMVGLAITMLVLTFVVLVWR